MARFYVTYRFRATSSEEVEAESLEAAEVLIEAKVDRDDFEPDVDDISDVDFEVQQMHPITRDGRELWTTYIRPGDTRGHQSAIDKAPLFSGVMEQEAAPVGAVGTR